MHPYSWQPANVLLNLLASDKSDPPAANRPTAGHGRSSEHDVFIEGIGDRARVNLTSGSSMVRVRNKRANDHCSDTAARTLSTPRSTGVFRKKRGSAIVIMIVETPEWILTTYLETGMNVLCKEAIYLFILHVT